MAQWMLRHRGLVSAAAALWAVFAVCGLLGEETDSVVLSNSFYTVLFFVSFACFFRRAFFWASKSRRRFLFSPISGFCFSLCIVIGTDMRVYGDIAYTPGNVCKRLFQAAGLSFPVCGTLLAACEYLPKAGQKTVDCRFARRISSCPFFRGRRMFFFSWAMIFLCWLPAFFAYFPGIFSYDVPCQVVQAVEHTYSTHHPLIHTLFLYGSMRLGYRLSGGYTAGVALYTVMQMLLLSGCFAYFCYSVNTACNTVMDAASSLFHWWPLLSAAFFALCPIVHLLAISATKDTLFSGFLLVCGTCVWKLGTNPTDFLRKKRNLLLFMGSAALMMLFRNNGVYGFLVMAAVLLLLFRREWKKLSVACIAALLLYQGVNHMLIFACHASPGSIAEMLSIPLQQLSRTLDRYPEAFTDKERDTFFEIVPEEDAAQYYDHLADLVKMNFNEKAFKENPLRYVKLWVKIGMRRPGCYFNAFFATTLGYWYPDDIFHAYIYAAERHGYLMTQHMGEIPNIGDTIVVDKHSFLPGLEQLYENMATWNLHQRLPVVSMLFAPGMHCWLLLFTIGFCVCQKCYGILPALALPFGLWLTLLLSPTVLMRYVFPITVFLPLMGICWTDNTFGRLQR